ncbi:isopeptide-forming domain-containing fimbrial protein [Luteimonas sp. R10]|uniref:DUF7927 domain-containing protein n=1 Tax=Luteimonas sp. R10 TaxID=3108176 RepID=UPI00308B961A|nr:isopeptide-forming domain-containing fimbrial protein [Luteimonas sp. R10]
MSKRHEILGAAGFCARALHALYPRRGRSERALLALLATLCLAVAPVPPAHAQERVVNTATVAPPDGVTDRNPDNNAATDDDPVSAAVVDFCPAGANTVFSIVNGVNIYRYEPGAGADVLVPELALPVSGNVNGMMVDPVRNRLLFVQRVTSTTTVLWAYDAANGGWYEARTPFPFASPDFPRAGMTPDGIGYMIAGGTATPQVWRVTADGAFGYTVALAGTLTFDIEPTDLGSGDIAFDGDGNGWLSAGQDLYRFDPNTLQATRQTQPLLNGIASTINWAGVAFGADGTLYVANSGSIAGEPATYYAYDPATGILTEQVAATSGASRDLASCAFPVLAEPELSVAKTLAEVNGVAYAPGAPVQAGDVLTYAIAISNAGGSVGTLFEGDVVETLPAGTTFVAAGNDFTCTGSDCPNDATFNIPANDAVTLAFVVQVDGPTPSGVDSIDNAVTVNGIDCTAPGNDCDETTPLAPAIAVVKTADPGDGTQVQPGETITYTLTTTVGGGATTAVFSVTDTLGAGLSFGQVTNQGDYTCSGELACSLPIGTPQGTYAVTYTATVDADATGTVGNSVAITGNGGDPEPVCTTCSTQHTIAPPAISTVKSANPADGSEVQPGQTITYTLTTTIATSATTADFVLTDTLGAGLSFGAVVDDGGFTCSGELVCTLPAGALPDTYVVTYTATVDDDATGTVDNSVVGTGGGDPDPECATCSTGHTIAPPAISTVKSASPADGSEVQPGETITYTLTTTVATSATTAAFELTDTLDAGLTFGAVTDQGSFTCSGELVCTLAAGALPDTYVVTYTATVDDDATGTVGNSVAITGDGGDPDPECATCSTGHTIAPPAISTVKSASPADGSEVQPGDMITYTLTTTVATSATTAAFELTDTLGAGLTFGQVTNQDGFTCSGELVCSLPAGTLPDTYTVTYTATVDPDATSSVGNSVAVTGNGGDPDPECTTCATEHTIVLPTIGTTKSADPANGTEVQPGQTIAYTLTTTIANSATTAPFRLVDTLGAGLTFGAVTDAGDFSCSGALDCVLPAGTLPGTYAVTYTVTVDPDATGTVGNSVAITEDGGNPDSACTVCETEHPVAPPAISAVKSANPAAGTEVRPGDTISYTLTTTIATSATTAPFRLVDTLGAGLTFGAVTDAGGYTCSGSLDCALPAGTLPGTYAVTYTATVDADATGTVGNSVAIAEDGGDPDSACTACETEHPIAPPAISTVKSADPADGSEVRPGDTITYTLTTTVATSATTTPFRLVDTLGAGLTFGAVTDTGDFACGGTLECTLPAGTLPGTYAVTYTATVDADATGSVGNSVVVAEDGGDPDPECATCGTEHTIELPTIVTAKSANPADGSEVRPGDTITYTLTTTVATSATTGPYRLVDTLGAGLTFGAVVDAGDFACGGTLECTLPAGTLPGTYVATYTATVDADATGAVGNSVVVAEDGGDPDPECTACETEHAIELPTITTVKTADPAGGDEVRPGDTITYTLATTIATSATTEAFRLTDTLGPGLTFGEVTDAGDFACADALVCTLPAGTLPGTYAVTYTATVDADAVGTVNNSVVGEGGGDPEPECTACSVEHEVELPAISTVKTADPADGSEVAVGDVITYTLTVTVATSATTAPFVLTDTLGDGQTLLPDSIVAPDGGSCEAAPEGPVCTLAEGALPGGYVFTYQTRVDPDAVGAVGNRVVGEGGGDPDPECAACSTEHPLAEPVVTIAKTSDPGDGAEVSVGDTILYTLSVTIENAAITTPVRLIDTPGPGLAVGTLPAGCSGDSGGIVCTMAVGTVPGVYTFSYPATVDASASGEVTNAVVSEYGGSLEPVCQPCGTTHQLADEPELRVVKTAGVRTAQVGDLVRYTLTVENVGVVNVSGATLVDTPPAGFSYVEGSMAVDDGDDAFDLAPSQSPLRIGGIDIAAGESATIVYLLRVGAGVRHGTQVNTAVAQDAAGRPISNTATAQVSVEADPLLDDSLIFGTVFNDRDGDGWQDSAALSGVRVQGGFAAGAYLAGSTTLDRGTGAEPVADASAPLLHGIAVGAIAARQSEADPGPQVVIRQRLREAAFTDDFVLTSDEGVTVRMDAAGTTTVDRSGAAAKGLNAAAPTVERRIAQGEGGVVVDYVIGNAGIDERGIPGVRIASVDGLLIETDQYGRYHLADVQGGTRGHRNFILKLDPSTLPPGTPLTTDNPLVRRITPGIPVRFDFGVQLPAEPIPGGTEAVELTLGEVIFAPGSAEVRSEYGPAIAKMAEQVNAYGGGEVVITANGDHQALAFDRASAVREALLAQVAPEHRQALTVSVHTEVHDLVAGVTEGGALLGTVLFDTDRSEIKPEFAPLLERVAARLEAMGGGAIAVVGHTDVRGPHAYNAGLGLRRARAVYEALAERLSPEVRAQVRVESSNDPTAPVGPERK